MTPDIYGLFMGDEPTAQEKAAALVQALRQRQASAMGDRGAAALFSLGANPLAAGLVRQANANAEATGQEAGQLQQMLGQAGQVRAGQALQRAMQLQQQQFQGGQNAAELAARAKEGAANRANALQLEGMRNATGLEERKIAAEAAKGAKASESETGLRKEFMGLNPVKDFLDVSVARDKVQRIASAAPTAAGDMSLIFNFMKIQDPGSTVREGEYASAQQARGVPEYIIGLYNRAKDGQLLSPAQRKDFLTQVERMYGAHQDQVNQLASQYQGLARGAGVDPARVVPLPQTVRTPMPPNLNLDEAQKPAAGTVRVSNGKETLEIPAADLAAAEADGYRRL